MPATTLRVWPADELTRIFPKDVAPRDAAVRARKGWEHWAARGEFVGLQLGIAGIAKLTDVTVVFDDLRLGRAGGSIPGQSVRVRWVGLVPVPIDGFDGLAAERPEEVPGWYPDPLIDTPPWIPAARSTPDSPVSHRSAAMHLSFRVPPGATAGIYRGRVSVIVAGKVAVRLPITLHVWPFAIAPSPRFGVANWFHLDCLTKHHRCEPWCAEHVRKLRV